MTAIDLPTRRATGVLQDGRAPLTAGLLLVVSAVAFEAMAVATALPAVSAELGHAELYAWAFSAFMLANLVAAVAASQSADRRGPARPYLVGVCLFAAGLTVAGLSPAMLVFVGARALQGAGAGAVSAMAYVSISRGYPDRLRARMMALQASAWVLPALVGPAIAGVVTEHASWRLVFIGLLPLPIGAAALTAPALRRMAVAEPARSAGNRVPAAFRLASGTGLVLASVEAPSPWLGVPALLIGVVLALPALRRLLPPGTLTARPGLPAGLAARGLLNFGYLGAEAFIPLALTSLRGLSVTTAGLTLTVAALSWTTGSWFQARLDARDGGRGRSRRVTLGFGVIVAGGMLMAVGVLAPAAPVALAALGWGVAGLGMGVAYPTLSVIVLRYAPTGEEGAVSGAMQVSEVLSVALGAGLGGAAINLARALAWSTSAGISLAFTVALAGTLLGILASLRTTNDE